MYVYIYIYTDMYAYIVVNFPEQLDASTFRVVEEGNSSPDFLGIP